jgi:hypothetical protein
MKEIVGNLKMAADKLNPYFMEDRKVKEKQENDQIPKAGTLEKNETQVKPTELTSIIAAIINGIGVGLLLGLLLGLAVSPVVSGVIGTLSSLLVILLGLNDKYVGTVKSLRIGAFGLFAVVGILLGMYIRTHNALSPPMLEMKQKYLETGFDENQSLYFTALKYFDHVPVGWFGTSEKDTIAFSKTDKSVKSHLFSSEIDAGQCALLKSANKDFPKSEIIYSFEAAGGVWKALALNLSDLPDEVFISALLAMRDGFCGLGQSGKIKIESSTKLKSLSAKDKLESITSTMNESGGSWVIILDNTKDIIPPNYQKSLYLQLIKLLANEKTN